MPDRRHERHAHTDRDQQRTPTSLGSVKIGAGDPRLPERRGIATLGDRGERPPSDREERDSAGEQQGGSGVYRAVAASDE